MIKISGRAIVSFVLISSSLSGSAMCQVDWTAIDAIKQLSDLKHKHAMELLEKQQNFERERMQAQSEASARQTQSYSNNPVSSGSKQGYVVAIDQNSLAGFQPATYKLGNGLVLQLTGLFRPDPPTVCIANCP